VKLEVWSGVVSSSGIFGGVMTIVSSFLANLKLFALYNN